MATVLALYKQPADPAAFDAYYYTTHVPLAKTLPGLRSYRVSTGEVQSPSGAMPLYLVAVLDFDSTAAIQAALASPEGAQVAGDLRNFAQAGVELLMFETKPV